MECSGLQSFLVWDQLVQEDEFAQQDELLLYFWPPTLEVNQGTFLMGACSAMLSFCSQISDEPVKTMRMEKTKATALDTGVVVLLLTGDSTDPDAVLQQQLLLLHRAFKFYFGSFEDILKEYAGRPRREMLDAIALKAHTLEPLIVHYFSNPVKSFDSLAYVDFPLSTNRHFLNAAQILSVVKEMDTKANLGGCIFFDTAICCTLMDLLTTRFVLSRIEYLNKASQASKSSVAAQPSNLHVMIKANEQHGKIIHPDPIPVFISDEELRILEIYTSGISEGEGENKRNTKRNKAKKEETEKQNSLSLHIFILDKVSLAVLTTSSSEQFQKTQDYIESKLPSLEAGLMKSFFEVQPTKKLVNNISIQLGPKELVTPSYHFLMHEAFTQMSIGSSLCASDPHFSANVAIAKNLFEEDPSASQIILRDYKNTGIFCRKMLGKEVYFQPTSSHPYEKFMRHIERTVQKSLKSEYNQDFF